MGFLLLLGVSEGMCHRWLFLTPIPFVTADTLNCVLVLFASSAFSLFTAVMKDIQWLHVLLCVQGSNCTVLHYVIWVVYKHRWIWKHWINPACDRWILCEKSCSHCGCIVLHYIFCITALSSHVFWCSWLWEMHCVVSGCAGSVGTWMSGRGCICDHLLLRVEQSFSRVTEC